jgi:hypothetical protein
MQPNSLMADAWLRYRRMRLGIYLPGDDRQRRFDRPIFAKALRRSWAEARARAGQAEVLRQRNAAVAAARNADDVALAAAATTLSPGQRRRRIDALRHELRLLPYCPLSIDIGALEARLTAELTALESISQIERKAA